MTRTDQRIQRALLAVFVLAAALMVGWKGYSAWQEHRTRREAAIAPRPRPIQEQGVKLLTTTAPIEAHAPLFTEVAAEAGLTYIQNAKSRQILNAVDQTGGAATADYDGDGWMDLLVTRMDAPPVLYRNLGPGTDGIVRFADVSASAGFYDPPLGGNGALWADIDNDGDPDLYLTTAAFRRHYLFINQGNGTFREEAFARGALVASEKDKYGQSAAAGDYDNDGYIDLAVADWWGPFHLLRNRGTAAPGHFEDVTAAAGVRTDQPLSFTPRFADLDQDGHLDIALTSDGGTSQLYWNDGDGTFTEGTRDAAVSLGESEMGSTIADYDGDGRLDWFVTSIHYGDTIGSSQGNCLYRNEGDRTFSERSRASGIGDAAWGWGTAFLDYDNDGDFDLIATNGQPPSEFPRFHADPTVLWRNNGEGGTATTFSDVSQSSGITDTGSGKGLVVFDYDNDGDQDVLIVNGGDRPLLYRNDGGNRNGWLRIRLTGTTCNRDAAGAVITVSDPRLRWPLVWETNLGSNFLSQSEPIAHFGLGAISDKVESVTIRWPSKTVQELRDVPVNQLLRLDEPAPVAARKP